MTPHSNLSGYHRVAGRPAVAPTRLPIMGGRSTPHTDTRTPSLFDDVGLALPREVERANVGRRAGAPAARDGDRTPADAPQADRQPRSPGGGGSDAFTTPVIPPLLLTVRQVEATLQLGRTRTYELLRSGQLPTLRVGRLIRVSRIALEEWIARQIAAGCD